MTEQEAIIIIAQKLNYISKIIIPNLMVYDNGQHELDLAVVNTAGKYLTEIEVKLSVADFRNDFKKNFAHQHRHCKYFYFAMPQEVYEKVKSEIPEKAGVIILEPYRIIKRPIKNKNLVPANDKKLLDYCRLLGIRYWKQLISNKKEVK